MKQPSFHIAVAIAVILLALASGCGGETEPTTTTEPVSLPPTRAPATATPTVEPSPTPTPPPPTATASTTLSASPTPEESPTPEPTASPEETEEPVALTAIGQLNAGMVGQEVTVEGSVVGTESFSGGFKFTLDDGTGQVVLLIWHNVYDDCWDAPGLNLGARVQATGEVGEYEGELQVEPSWGGAVKALEPAAAWAEPREIGTLTNADEGQRVMFEGEVVRTGGFASAVEIYVSDGTGEMKVFIWRNVLDRIPDNVALGTPGSRVRVVGTVTIYRDTLEVVPTLPYDVTVLEIP